jgi:hypothetical protein
MIPAMVGGMFGALLAQYLAARLLIRLGVPLTHEVEPGRVGAGQGPPQQRTRVSLAVDVVAYLGGLVGGAVGVGYLIQWARGG